MQKERIAYYDIVKSIGIFLVIVGHAITNDSKLGIILYSFHMPLFFMISGMLIGRKAKPKSLKQEFVKMFYQLVVPYFIWGLIYASFSFKNLLFIGYGSWWTLKFAESLSSLWFLPVIFLAKALIVSIMFHFSDRIAEKTIFSNCISAALFFVIGTITKHTNSFGWPWSIDVAFMAAGFMCLGVMIFEIFQMLLDKSKIVGIIAIVSILIFVLSHIFIEKSNHFVLMANADYGDTFVFFFNSVIGSIAVFALTYLVTAPFCGHSIVKRILLFVGQNTMAIFILHKPFLEFGFNVAAKYEIGINTWWFATSNVVIAFVLSMFVTIAIRKICPQIIGKYDR